MLALATPIVQRLAALSALTGWSVRNAADEASRTAVPAAEVWLPAAGAKDQQAAVTVQVAYGVRLIAKRGAGATDQLDTAFAAVIASLHNWKPGSAGGRAWMRMYLANVAPADIEDTGLVAYDLIFQTSAPYDGQKP